MTTPLMIALLSTNTVQLSWVADPKAFYEVLQAPEIHSTNWTTLTNISGRSGEVFIDTPSTNEQQFYRLVQMTHPLQNKALYINTNTPAARQVTQWRLTRPADAALLESRLANKATAIWINSSSDISRIRETFAKCGNSVPTFILYNIYQRDEQAGLSSGGAKTPAEYKSFIDQCFLALKAKPCMVIIEPDALPSVDALPVANRPTRYELLNYATSVLGKLTTALVYLDSGHPHWVENTSTMASELGKAGVRNVRGFSLNISNYIWTTECVTYGKAITKALGGNAHFVIDTSRNGQGPTATYQWCDPDGRGLGLTPTLSTGIPEVDALGYYKYPGEADGCKANAGTWLPEEALKLAQKAVQ